MYFFPCKVRLGFALFDKLTVVDFFRDSVSIPYNKYIEALWICYFCSTCILCLRLRIQRMILGML